MKKYLLPISIFMAFIILTYYIFFTCLTSNLSDNEKILGIISFLGLGFGVFQLAITEINTNARRQSDLRFQVSNDIIRPLESIGELLIKEQLNLKKDPLGVVIVLMNQINAFSTTVLNSEKNLFPKITDTTEFNQLNDIIHKLNEKAIEIYNNWPKEMKSLNEPMHFAEYGIILKNNKEMGDLLQDFFKCKQQFYKVLFSYD